MSFAFWEKKEPKQVQGLLWNHSLLRPHYDCWKEVHYNCIKKAHYPQAHTLTSYNACDQREQHDCARILRGFIKNTVSSFFAHSWSVGPSSNWRVVSSDKKFAPRCHFRPESMRWINLYWEDILTTSFPGFFLLLEKEPWLRLVMWLPVTMNSSSG